MLQIGSLSWKVAGIALAGLLVLLLFSPQAYEAMNISPRYWEFLDACLPIVASCLALVSLLNMGVPVVVVGVGVSAAILGANSDLFFWTTDALVSGTYGSDQWGFNVYVPAYAVHTSLNVNVVGAVIPLLISGWLLRRAPLCRVALAIAAAIPLGYALSWSYPDVGIMVDAVLIGAGSALIAMAVSPGMAAPVAYIAGTVGTLVGADLARLPEMVAAGSPWLSIGGGGLSDGLFVIPLLAAALAIPDLFAKNVGQALVWAGQIAEPELRRLSLRPVHDRPIISLIMEYAPE